MSNSSSPIFRSIVGTLYILTAIPLLIGGVYLLSLGGSFYYAIAGAALLASGVFIILGRSMGAWIYLGLFAFTLIWSVIEAGDRFWAWIPRLGGPLVFLILLFLVIPTLRPRLFGFRTGLTGILASLLLVGIGGSLIYDDGNGHAIDSKTLSAERETQTLTQNTDWKAYGNTDGERYADISQINVSNVSKLKKVWVAHTGDLPDNMSDNKYGAETTALKVKDRLYLCTATNNMLAINASTGEVIWRFDAKLDKDWIPYTAACRSASYYESPDIAADAECHARIIEGTLDARIIAVDAETGEPCSDFGENGNVSVLPGLGPVVPGMVAMTSPPAIVDNVIVVGWQVLDGQKLSAPSGVIKGFDARTGEWLWSWDMTHPDWDVEPPEGETFTRGTPNMWTSAIGDDKLDLVYLPLGNAAVDYWSGDRTDAENEYSSSLVAVNVKTGKDVWHFQTVHKDVWDYDLGSQATLANYPTADGTVPAIILPSKQGEIYVLNRETGEPLTGVTERPAPVGGVEPDERAPTQPHSEFNSLAKPDLTEKQMWGMSLIDQMVCRIQYRKASYDGMYTPPEVDEHWIEYPGYNGGSDWGSLALDPDRRIIVANYNDMPNYNRLVTRAEADKKGWKPRGETSDSSGKAEGAGDPQAGAPYAINVNAGWRLKFTGMLCKEPPYGGIRAIDLATGETLWDRPLGKALKNGPFGIPSHLPLLIGTPNNGGPLVTAGDLIFVAATTDDLIRAIDINTGETVWSDTLPAGGQATPMTYMQDGRQYIVLMTGGHHFMKTKVGDEVIAWALPG